MGLCNVRLSVFQCAAISFSFVLFFNYTATTESYTYGRPLSLHDALPILQTTLRQSEHLSLRAVLSAEILIGLTLLALLSLLPVWIRRRRHHRSEEHTSELQSLMRISYAVFCLKRKTDNKHPNTNDLIASQHSLSTKPVTKSKTQIH